jgi:hypothetical protein
METSGTKAAGMEAAGMEAAEVAGAEVGDGAGALGVGVGPAVGDVVGRDVADEPEGTGLELVAPAADDDALGPPAVGVAAPVGTPRGAPVGVTGGIGTACPAPVVPLTGGAGVVLTSPVVEDGGGRVGCRGAGNGSRPPGFSGCPVKLTASSTT